MQCSGGILHQPLPVPQRWVTHSSCHSRYSAFPQRAPIPISAGLSFLQTGRGTASGSPGHCATLHSDVETQPPNLESSSVSKNRHELKIPSQNETSPSLWFKVSCIKTNLQTAAFAHKRFCFQEEGLFFRELNTKPAHLSCHRVRRRSAWQLRSQAGHCPFLLPSCCPSPMCPGLCQCQHQHPHQCLRHHHRTHQRALD